MWGLRFRVVKILEFLSLDACWWRKRVDVFKKKIISRRSTFCLKNETCDSLHVGG